MTRGEFAFAVISAKGRPGRAYRIGETPLTITADRRDRGLWLKCDTWETRLRCGVRGMWEEAQRWEAFAARDALAAVAARDETTI